MTVVISDLHGATRMPFNLVSLDFYRIYKPRSSSSSQRHACHAAGGVSRGCGTATVAAMARTSSPRRATIGARARRAPSRSGLRQRQLHYVPWGLTTIVLVQSVCLLLPAIVVQRSKCCSNEGSQAERGHYVSTLQPADR